MPLGDGSSVRLTIARYYTPTGRSIQKPYGDGDYESAQDRYASGELQYKDSIPVIDSLAYTTPKGKQSMAVGVLYQMYLSLLKTMRYW
jgi:carboxyl-terminal processing protease